MKKSFIILFFFSMLALNSQGSLNTIIPPTEPLYSIGHGVKLTYEQLTTLTPREYKKLTGHKLGMYKSIALKIVHKKMAKSPYFAGDKSQLVALLLCIFVGALGIHRFYLGYTWQGIVQLLTLGGLGVWALIDLIRIITGDLKPKDGEYNPSL